MLRIFAKFFNQALLIEEQEKKLRELKKSNKWMESELKYWKRWAKWNSAALREEQRLRKKLVLVYDRSKIKFQKLQSEYQRASSANMSRTDRAHMLALLNCYINRFDLDDLTIHKTNALRIFHKILQVQHPGLHRIKGKLKD